MIKIVCVGKVKEKYLREAIDDYEKRIGTVSYTHLTLPTT